MRIKSSKKKEEFKPPYIEEKDGYLEKLQKFLNPQDDGLFMEREMKSPNFVRSKKGWMIDDQGKAYFNNVEIYSNAENAITIDYGSDILLEHGGDIKFTSVTAPTACTATLIATDVGNVDAGTHKYKVTFVNATGETELGAESNEITADATHKQVALSNIPTSPSGSVTSRKIYRRKAGGSWYYLLTTISDNIATTYTDNIADANLTGEIADFKENDSFGKIIINDIESLSIGSSNTFLGYSAGHNNVVGYKNVFLGYKAGYSGTAGYENVFLGYNAGNSITKGHKNIFLGCNAGQGITEGHSNIFLGYNVGRVITSGHSNIFLGIYAGDISITGHHNIFLGNYAGNNNYEYENIFIGHSTGHSNNGHSNIFLGYQAGYYETGDNKLFIDNASRSNEADGRVKALIYGVFNSTALSQQITFNVGTLNILDGGNIATGTGTGLKIGTATSQKLGFYNATPVDQPITVADATDSADVILRCNDIIDRLQELGLIA